MAVMNYTQLSRDYQRIEQVLIYLEQNFARQPSLTEIADTTGLSEYHLQRIFCRWVGITPKRFLQFLTKEYAKELMKSSPSLMDVAYEAGLSSLGRLHDLFINCEAVTPGEYKKKGENLTIIYGFHPTPFGECFLAVTDRGICSLSFIQENNHKQVIESFESGWKHAKLCENPCYTHSFIDLIFSPNNSNPQPLHLFLKGTNFQIKVWEALLKIPQGTVVSYNDIAKYIEMPKACRAVGNAVGKNPIALIIPCHRVIRKASNLGGYRYGLARKKAILGWEAAQLSHI